jgi:hypothetical protein
LIALLAPQQFVGAQPPTKKVIHEVTWTGEKFVETK